MHLERPNMHFPPTLTQNPPRQKHHPSPVHSQEAHACLIFTQHTVRGTVSVSTHATAAAGPPLHRHGTAVRRPVERRTSEEPRRAAGNRVQAAGNLPGRRHDTERTAAAAARIRRACVIQGQGKGESVLSLNFDMLKKCRYLLYMLYIGHGREFWMLITT